MVEEQVSAGNQTRARKLFTDLFATSASESTTILKPIIYNKEEATIIFEDKEISILVSL